MATIFTRIINGEIPCYKVAEDKEFIAFLDINPLMRGHTLVVPKPEVDYIFDMEDQMLSEMILFAKRIAVRIKEKIDCKRVAVMVIGLEVPHCHIHLIPINSEGDLNLRKERPQFTQAEFIATAQDLLIEP